jgi:hypothetical protein
MMTAAIITGAPIRANTIPQPPTYFLPAAHWAAVSYLGFNPARPENMQRTLVRCVYSTARVYL